LLEAGKKVTIRKLLQRSKVVAVKVHMHIAPNALLQFASLALVAACASGDSIDQRYAPAASEAQHSLQCGPGRVAVCVEVNCDPSDYVCAEQRDLRGLFEPRNHE